MWLTAAFFSFTMVRCGIFFCKLCGEYLTGSKVQVKSRSFTTSKWRGTVQVQGRGRVQTVLATSHSIKIVLKVNCMGTWGVRTLQTDSDKQVLYLYYMWLSFTHEVLHESRKTRPSVADTLGDIGNHKLGHWDGIQMINPSSYRVTYKFYSWFVNPIQL